MEQQNHQKPKIRPIKPQPELFDDYEREGHRMLELGLPWPAYDYCLKCSHVFNLLEARGAISITERNGYIGRVRALASGVASQYVRQREEQGHPLLRGAEGCR